MKRERAIVRFFAPAGTQGDIFCTAADLADEFWPDIGDVDSYREFRAQWKRQPSSFEVRAHKYRIEDNQWLLVDPDCRIFAVYMRETKRGLSVRIRCSDAPDFLEAFIGEINRYGSVNEVWTMDVGA